MTFHLSYYLTFSSRVAAQIPGAHTGRTINLAQPQMSRFAWWTEDVIKCPTKEYVVMCQYQWQKVSICTLFYHIY